MKISKSRKRYCKKCDKHTDHTVAQAKNTGRSKTHPMSRGSRKRMRLRGQDRGAGNHGRTSKGAMSSFKRYGAKTSKKLDLRFKCKICNKTSVQGSGLRVKRPEFT